VGNNALSWQSDPSDFIGQAIGSPVTLTSGYRTPQHNAAVGGVPNSQHLTGNAYDFVPKGMNTTSAANRLVQSGIPFDQVIDEGSHVHVSFAPSMRRQVIGQMPQAQATQGPSDSDLLAALSGKPVAQPTAAPGRQAAGQQFPAGDSRNDPAAMTGNCWQR
jgi:hypothetical protein